MVFLLSNRFGMVLVAVVIAVDATLNMLAVNDVADPPPGNDNNSLVRSTVVRRWSMVLSRTCVPTMVSVIDAKSGFVDPMLLSLVYRPSSQHTTDTHWKMQDAKTFWKQLDIFLSSYNTLHG